MNYINFIYNHPGVFYYLAAIIIIIVISIWRKWYILDKKTYSVKNYFGSLSEYPPFHLFTLGFSHGGVKPLCYQHMDMLDFMR